MCPMRRNLSLCIFLMLAPGASDMALADMRSTPHSLMRNPVVPDVAGICVFCHTPTLNGTPPVKAPLWQPSVGTSAVFTIYDDIGRLGLGKPSVGSQSIACLSCHDANQARTISKTSADHPFGVPYRGTAKNRMPALSEPTHKPYDAEMPAIWAKKLISLDDFHDASQGIIENRTVWWVSMSGDTTRRTRNDLPLYNRTDEATGEEVPYIECSTCHDPHSNKSKFLRQSNEGSRMCLTCHTK
jgi:predicted CXXCH cytochrome family protein